MADLSPAGVRLLGQLERGSIVEAVVESWGWGRPRRRYRLSGSNVTEAALELLNRGLVGVNQNRLWVKLRQGARAPAAYLGPRGELIPAHLFSSRMRDFRPLYL